MSGEEKCTENCSTCGKDCAGRKKSREEFLVKPHDMSHVKKVVAVISGKGGVGKSLVTSMLAVTMNRRGYKTAVLDADITGPSIPKAFGITEKAGGSEAGLFPVHTKTGVKVMSVNLLLKNDTDPVVWRGPIIAGTVKQFWSDVIWEDVDYMFVDMPPGTGDVPLTVFQSLPVDGLIVVTSPQDLVSMIVGKAVKMAKMMNIPIIGLVENYSYVVCPDCGRKIQLFGEGKTEEAAAGYGLPLLGRVPVDPELARICDAGLIELFEGDYAETAADAVEKSCPII